MTPARRLDTVSMVTNNIYIQAPEGVAIIDFLTATFHANSVVAENHFTLLRSKPFDGILKVLKFLKWIIDFLNTINNKLWMNLIASEMFAH